MGNILSRIQEIALKEGITIGSVERVIGASKGVLSRAINSGTDIQSKWLQKLVENYPQYSADWLLTGEGSMIKEKQDEDKTVANVMDASCIYDMYKDYKNMQDSLNTEIKELQAENKVLAKELTELKLKSQKQEAYIEKLVRALEHYENIGTIHDLNIEQVHRVGDAPFDTSSLLTPPPSAHANARLGKGKNNKI